MRNSDSGATPIVFYITAGDRLVPADVVVVVMENARIREVGGYQVREHTHTHSQFTLLVPLLWNRWSAWLLLEEEIQTWLLSQRAV